MHDCAILSALRLSRAVCWQALFFGGLPPEFEEAMGGGGFGGMPGRGGGRRRPPADTNKMYEILGVNKSDYTRPV